MTERKRRKDVLSTDIIEIVQLSPDDWEQLRDLKIQSLAEEPNAIENPIKGVKKYQNRSEREWRIILSGGMSGERRGETTMFFATDGDKCVGMVSSIIPETDAGKDKVATIQHTYVKRDVRRRGAGKKLINTLLGTLRTRGDISKVKLNVVVTQTPAINLYKSVGFEIIGTTKGSIDWTEEPLDEYNMELKFQ